MSTKDKHYNLQNWLVVVPARLASQRLPRKALRLLHGRPLILCVYDNIAALTTYGAQVTVATDAKEIFDLCKENSVPVRMTATTHNCGTERCYEVAASSSHRYVLNVQGDEPAVRLQDLLALCHKLEEVEEDTAMATLVFASTAAGDYHNPQVVKAVADSRARALYFSRRALPYAAADSIPRPFLKHIGVYAYTRDALERFSAATASELEKQEKLEQLRAIDIGIPIYLCRATHDTKGIDTAADLAQQSPRHN